MCSLHILEALYMKTKSDDNLGQDHLTKCEKYMINQHCWSDKNSANYLIDFIGVIS